MTTTTYVKPELNVLESAIRAIQGLGDDKRSRVKDSLIFKTSASAYEADE